jgi:hypothetical protein
MGNARVIFVGAVSVVLGLYSVGLQRSERAVNRVAEVHAYQMQAEEIAKAATSLAIYQLGTTKPSTLPQLTTGRSMFKGTGSYSTADAGGSDVTITATGLFNEKRWDEEAEAEITVTHTVVRVTVVRLSTAATTKKQWSNWQIVKARTVFGSSEFTNQFLTE